MQDLQDRKPWSGLIDRVKNILMKPKEAWETISRDRATPGDVLVNYVLPLAALGPICSFIGGQLFGFGGLFFSYRPSLLGSLGGAALEFISTLVMLVLVTFIADKLAPKFGGESNTGRAFKWIGYGATASFVAGVFGLVPGLGVLGLLGLYSLYLLYVGATPMMSVPRDKALGFTAATVACGILVSIVLGVVTSAVSGVFGFGASAIGSVFSSDDDIEERDSGSISIPGVGTIDVGEMEEAAERMEQMANGEIEPVPSSELAELLPESIGSYTLTSRESGSVANFGSRASATYEDGDHSFELEIADATALGGLSGFASALQIEQNREDGDSYERIENIDGRMVMESWRESSERGEYGVMVAERFLVKAEGTVEDIDELKAAVATVDEDDLEDLGD